MDKKPALELPNELTWLNAEPQQLSAHHGRVVVLLFWNASSVYSHNALLELYQLQRKFPESVSAIAIHVPKFTAELDDKIILEVCNRFDVHVIVANDKACLAWQAYQIESWPTFVLIDSHGMLVDRVLGDMHYKELVAKINTLTSVIPENLSLKPRALKSNPKNKSFSVLNHPCGILLHKGLLYVTDTGNNRILECTTEGRIKRVFGNGLALNIDGPALESAFCRPVGLCLAREYLYVADSGNHAIRRVRLIDGYVDTLLGNGAPGRACDQVVSDYHHIQFNNPTSVNVCQDVLVVADSGNNCLWMYNLVSRTFSLLVGSGELGLVDGVGSKAEMAHPLAITGSKNCLYIAEGSSSSIRTVSVPDGLVKTLVGQGLFHYGSNDGDYQSASLQYPCSLVLDDKRQILWIADSYNRKIRTYDLKNNILTNCAMPSNFLNPCAIATDDDSIWIVDSITDTIYRYYLATDYLTRITIQDS
ncbi:MAG: hypothetical protein KA902_00830 [Arenimonas sp.]|nr:hypothetical protein [Arenimonas sp.]